MKNEDLKTLQNLQGFYLNELEKRGSEENIKMLVVKDLLHLLIKVDFAYCFFETIS